MPMAEAVPMPAERKAPAPNAGTCGASEAGSAPSCSGQAPVGFGELQRVTRIPLCTGPPDPAIPAGRQGGGGGSSKRGIKAVPRCEKWVKRGLGLAGRGMGERACGERMAVRICLPGWYIGAGSLCGSRGVGLQLDRVAGDAIAKDRGTSGFGAWDAGAQLRRVAFSRRGSSAAARLGAACALRWQY